MEELNAVAIGKEFLMDSSIRKLLFMSIGIVFVLVAFVFATAFIERALGLNIKQVVDNAEKAFDMYVADPATGAWQPAVIILVVVLLSIVYIFGGIVPKG